MKTIADLHIHSRYSRATSPKLNLPCLERWARIKGIGLLGSGDCTHPAWLAELRAHTDDAEEGFYTLKNEARAAFDAGPALTEGLPRPGARSPEPGAAGIHATAAGINTPAAGAETADAAVPRFVLTGEIGTIYKKGDKTRKIHHLVILPDFKAAAVFNARLEGLGGNIRSDGRPILGIDSRDLLALLLEADERALLIPAHIWTPWFSALGEKSGFDSIEECYGDLSGFIPAVETGLSSNPPMNWALNRLQGFSIISNSDAHSPDKLGREATIFDMPLSYASLRAALSPHSPALLGTVEFFPQEGKYHYDGHRKCGVSMGPEEAAAANGLCPVCGKALTRGVMGRVLELADRPVDEAAPCPPERKESNRRPYYSLIPLREIVAELAGTGPASKKTEAAYCGLIEKGGSEFSILMDLDREKLENLSVPGLPGEILAQGIMKMRAGEVSAIPGYDGEYGSVRVFGAGAIPGLYGKEGGRNLFGETPEASAAPGPAVSSPPSRRKKAGTAAEKNAEKREAEAGERLERFKLDEDQEKAVAYRGKAALVIAGPGTGKTAALSARIARLIREGADPASILAVTFTVKAAAEIGERIRRLCGPLAARSGPAAPPELKAATFHSFCCALLREYGARGGLSRDFKIIGEAERDALLREIGGKRARRLGAYIEERKRLLLLPGETYPGFIRGLPLAFVPEMPPPESGLEALYGEYRAALKKSASLDFEDLSAGAARLLAACPEILASCRRNFRYVFVDEYQDINFSQYLLIRLLAPGGGAFCEGPSLWAIGDPNQAIYGFRGSDKRFIDCFFRDYPGAGRFSLSKSFRCAGPIIDAAGTLAGTRLRAAASENAAEISLYRTRYATEKAEAEGIARAIEALIGGTGFLAMDSGLAGEFGSGKGGVAPSDCAVLVRTASLAEPIARALEDRGIPFEFSGEGPWWQKEPASSLLQALRARRNDSPALGPRDGVVDAEKPGVLIRAAWEELAKKEKRNPPRAPERSAKSNAGSFAEAEIPELVERLLGFAEYFGDLASLLDALDSCAASGIPEPGAPDSQKTGGAFIRNGGVRAMTIHASKGLEFDQVFVAGLEEGILPFTLFDKTGEGLSEAERARVLRSGLEKIEEERRLLYVAMTRAKRGLWLSCAETRSFRGRKLKSPPSRFLSELEEKIPLAPRGKTPKRDGQLSLF